MFQWRFGLNVGEGVGSAGNGSSGSGRTRKANGRKRAHNPAGAAIVEILDTYDERDDIASGRKEARQEDRAAFRAAALTMLADVIGPTLDAIGEEVLSRGHHWSVEGRVEIQSQPAVACLFRPRSEEGDGPASELTFRCLYPDRVSTTALIHRKGETIDPLGRSHAASGVSAELVSQEVARFMAMVLGLERTRVQAA